MFVMTCVISFDLNVTTEINGSNMKKILIGYNTLLLILTFHIQGCCKHIGSIEG